MGLLSALRASAAPSTLAQSEDAPRPFNPETNPYKAKRPWPPDFSRMTLQQQFAYEKRYKRRAKNSYMRPSWVRKTKLAQLILVTGAELPPIERLDGDGTDDAWPQGSADICCSSQSSLRATPIPLTRYVGSLQATEEHALRDNGS